MTDITEKMREVRLRWLGHVMRQKEEEPARIAMEMEVKGTRSRGRPKMRWRECIAKDMKRKGVEKEDAAD